MGWFEWSAVLLCLAAAASAAWLLEHVRLVRALRLANMALATQDSTLRLLRLSASDQRNVALTLFGHAQAAVPADMALTALARRLLDMSEDLAAQTESTESPRTLVEEEMALAPALEFAVAQVVAHLGPSRRAWRIAPALQGARIMADRRALNQVLVHVLSGASASTRDGDWIELSAEDGAAEWSLTVQDEGIGVPVAEGDRHPEESRGIGLRLTLARSLMQAHGGSLIVTSTEGVGTMVRLGFPRTRVVRTEEKEAVLS